MTVTIRSDYHGPGDLPLFSGPLVSRARSPFVSHHQAAASVFIAFDDYGQ